MAITIRITDHADRGRCWTCTYWNAAYGSRSCCVRDAVIGIYESSEAVCLKHLSRLPEMVFKSVQYNSRISLFLTNSPKPEPEEVRTELKDYCRLMKTGRYEHEDESRAY